MVAHALVVVLFWKIKLPFHSRHFEATKKMKCVHIGCVIVGILFPFIPVISIMSSYAVHVKSSGGSFTSGGLGFTIPRFPPVPCHGRDNDVVFYSFMLPLFVVLFLTITLTFLILWTVIKVSHNSIK